MLRLPQNKIAMLRSLGGLLAVAPNVHHPATSSTGSTFPFSVSSAGKQEKRLRVPVCVGQRESKVRATHLAETGRASVEEWVGVAPLPVPSQPFCWNLGMEGAQTGGVNEFVTPGLSWGSGLVTEALESTFLNLCIKTVSCVKDEARYRRIGIERVNLSVYTQRRRNFQKMLIHFAFCFQNKIIFQKRHATERCFFFFFQCRRRHMKDITRCEERAHHFSSKSGDIQSRLRP